ncbi:hypothetical protein pVco7_gp093 [Vibrio phage pVco-7]|uniref:Uncharacterized protein n=1 Tax=Vibrio phage pVco-5 TaxID=1965485 RepID=A0A1W6JUY3_9CAUD|nr:hypothetical protein KNT61_gp093 [Vibrio phage pVco-5]ARM71081.1 hypothetical protein pVco5_093 [Vibrio phage pVco-5]
MNLLPTYEHKAGSTYGDVMFDYRDEALNFQIKIHAWLVFNIFDDEITPADEDANFKRITNNA